MKGYTVTYQRENEEIVCIILDSVLVVKEVRKLKARNKYGSEVFDSGFGSVTNYLVQDLTDDARIHLITPTSINKIITHD